MNFILSNLWTFPTRFDFILSIFGRKVNAFYAKIFLFYSLEYSWTTLIGLCSPIVMQILGLLWNVSTFWSVVQLHGTTIDWNYFSGVRRDIVGWRGLCRPHDSDSRGIFLQLQGTTVDRNFFCCEDYSWQKGDSTGHLIQILEVYLYNPLLFILLNVGLSIKGTWPACCYTWAYRASLPKLIESKTVCFWFSFWCIFSYVLVYKVAVSWYFWHNWVCMFALQGGSINSYIVHSLALWFLTNYFLWFNVAPHCIAIYSSVWE
jgi:hypothetical protein